MAKGERTVNPATAHLKQQNKQAIKKNKAQVAAQRNEKLARRNPDRLQKQIDELKALPEAERRPHDKQVLEQLERDVKAIRKAREVTGHQEEAPKPDRQRGARDEKHARGPKLDANSTALGKRRRGFGDDNQSEESEETDEEARKIPMPRDTPPPVPTKPRKRQADGQRPTDAPKEKPQQVAQVTYSAAPQIRNLQKESTSKFVPSAVAQRLKQAKGESGRYLEPEEVDKLEKSGYLDARKAADAAGKEEGYLTMGQSGSVDGGALEEEEAAFERELKAMEAEEARKNAALADAENVAQEARREAEYSMMAEEAERRTAGEMRDQESLASRHLRHVEMEEVEDEGD